MSRFFLFKLPIWLAILGMNPAVRSATNVWTSIGPDGGRVQAIAVDPQNPDTVYAVAGGSIFKTTDGAANWNRVYSPATSDGGASNPAIVVAVHPNDSNTLYAGTANGIFKSTDGGANWNMANAGLPKPPSIPNVYVGTTSVGVLAIDPGNPETIYASVAFSPKLFKSTDGGASWSAASSGLTVDLVTVDGTHFVAYLFVGSLAIDPQDSNTLYAACASGCPPGGGLFKSTDGGANWSASGVGLPGSGVLALAIDPRNPNTLYAAPRSGLVKSTDGGASWSAASSGLSTDAYYANALLPIVSLAIDPQNPDTLYASTRTCMPCTPVSGVFKSTDGGASWTGSGLASSILVDPCCSFPVVLAIDPIHPKTVYAGTYNGIVKSLDAGASWNAANSGLTASQIDSLTIDPQNAGALFATSQGKVLRTADGGAHWSQIYNPLPSDDGRATYPASMLVADPGAPGTYYVGIDGNSDGGGGASWIRMPLPGPGGVRALSMDPQNPSTLYASVPEHALYKSTDGGASWNEIAGRKELKEDPTGAPTQCFGSVLIDPRNPSTLYVGICGSGGGLLKSMDGGQTWTMLVIPTDYPFSGILAMDPQNSGTFYVSDYPHVLKTTDGGQNWRAFSSGLPATAGVRSIAVHPQNSNIVYAATNFGVFWSTNSGAHWSPLNAGLTNLNVRTLLIDPRNPEALYAGTYDGGVFAMTFAPKP
jgi:photosystem II stability/assembly factor-like uncharacterized protein